VIHAKELLDRLESLPTVEFDDEVFRATRLGLDPLTASTRGGRWSPRDVLGGTESVATLYTSCIREGALAQLKQRSWTWWSGKVAALPTWDSCLPKPALCWLRFNRFWCERDIASWPKLIGGDHLLARRSELPI
jgi:hypothetical protein